MSQSRANRSRARNRLAYSTEGTAASVCRHCGKRLGTCSCLAKQQEPVPEKLVAKLRIEKVGRGGKTVTVVYDLPRNAEFLKVLSKELKAACGGGGKAGESTVEVQGEHREKIRGLLIAKGWTVKG